MLKASFVIPWYGTEIPGGAEAECRGVAESLSAQGIPVEVLTTCLHSHGSSWDQDFHPQGETNENGVVVRRFPIDPRNAPLFNLLNSRLMAGLPLPPRQEAAFLENMVNSRALYHFISKANGRLFFPLPYLFSTTFMTIRMAASRTVPIACLHDEGYAYLKPIRQAFRGCPGVIFLSRAEKKLSQDLWGLEEAKCHLFGAGVEIAPMGDAESFRAKYHIESPFILYAGRRDQTKNTPLLVDYFTEYKRRSHDQDIKLVLIGDQPINIPSGMEPEIIDLGFIPKEDKPGAFAAASMFCQPSVNESFSIVIMEAWLNQTPVLVHQNCDVTRDHALDSGGGMPFASAGDFAQAVETILKDPGKSFSMAESGRRYVVRNYAREVIAEKYISLLKEAESWSEPGNTSHNRHRTTMLRQIIPLFRPGLNLLGESWSIAHLLSEPDRNGGVYAHSEDTMRLRGLKPLSWLAGDLGPEDLVLAHYDVRCTDTPYLEELTGIPGKDLMIRLHGDISRDMSQEEQEALLFLAIDRGVTLLCQDQASWDHLNRLGFDRVRVVPPVTVTDHNWVDAQQAESCRIVLLSDDSTSECISRVLAAFAIVRRLKPEATLDLLGGRNSDYGDITDRTHGGELGKAPISQMKVRRLIDPLCVFSAADVVISRVNIFSWAIAHAFLSGIPVLSPDLDPTPSILAESITALVDDGELRQGLVEVQKGGMAARGNESPRQDLMAIIDFHWQKTRNVPEQDLPGG